MSVVVPGSDDARVFHGLPAHEHYLGQGTCYRAANWLRLLPFDRLAEIMRDLFACETFSEGTLANFSQVAARLGAAT